MDDFERSVVVETLRSVGGNKAEAARRLGMTARGFYKLLNRIRLGDGKDDSGA